MSTTGVRYLGALLLLSSGTVAPSGCSAGEACPGEQRDTCREALEQGGSVCGTGATADAYQGLMTCACAGDTAPCSRECGTELCAGEATPLGSGACWVCLATTQCEGYYTSCADR